MGLGRLYSKLGLSQERTLDLRGKGGNYCPTYDPNLLF